MSPIRRKSFKQEMEERGERWLKDEMGKPYAPTILSGIAEGVMSAIPILAPFVLAREYSMHMARQVGSVPKDYAKPGTLADGMECDIKDVNSQVIRFNAWRSRYWWGSKYKTAIDYVKLPDWLDKRLHELQALVPEDLGNLSPDQRKRVFEHLLSPNQTLSRGDLVIINGTSAEDVHRLLMKKIAEVPEEEREKKQQQAQMLMLYMRDRLPRGGVPPATPAFTDSLKYLTTAGYQKIKRMKGWYETQFNGLTATEKPSEEFEKIYKFLTIPNKREQDIKDITESAVLKRFIQKLNIGTLIDPQLLQKYQAEVLRHQIAADRDKKKLDQKLFSIIKGKNRYDLKAHTELKKMYEKAATDQRDRKKNLADWQERNFDFTALVKHIDLALPGLDDLQKRIVAAMGPPPDKPLLAQLEQKKINLENAIGITHAELIKAKANLENLRKKAAADYKSDKIEIDIFLKKLPSIQKQIETIAETKRKKRKPAMADVIREIMCENAQVSPVAGGWVAYNTDTAECHIWGIENKDLPAGFQKFEKFAHDRGDFWRGLVECDGPPEFRSQFEAYCRERSIRSGQLFGHSQAFLMSEITQEIIGNAQGNFSRGAAVVRVFVLDELGNVRNDESGNPMVMQIPIWRPTEAAPEPKSMMKCFKVPPGFFPNSTSEPYVVDPYSSRGGQTGNSVAQTFAVYLPLDEKGEVINSMAFNSRLKVAKPDNDLGKKIEAASAAMNKAAAANPDNPIQARSAAGANDPHYMAEGGDAAARERAAMRWKNDEFHPANALRNAIQKIDEDPVLANSAKGLEIKAELLRAQAAAAATQAETLKKDYDNPDRSQDAALGRNSASGQGLRR